ncbi:hypothetical protein TSAR_015622 [Trichomalopsis sarcophagae]|uniref:K Homology domain-containing protein n=1 Tax=Trichomalopsis sarcophagae TaxID=543379 RepID=A0A232EKX5_9HYME|nr:hypothetical protein TSAR_015622 [Trichomalopsis sarcophagae]
MFCSIIRNNGFNYLSCINCISPFKNASMTKSIYPMLMLQDKKLADLAEEQEIFDKSKKLVMNVRVNLSESESESIDQEIIESIPIEKVPYKEDQYQHSFNINRNHYKHIVGVKGTMLQKLCSETKTIIRVSKKKKHVVIIGSIQKRIIHAKRRIDNLIQSSNNKLSFTHFISIPTNVSEVQQHFLKFKEDVLINCDKEATGIDKDMFQKPEKLHLTICMLHLLEDTDQRKAIRALNACKKEIIDPILQEKGPLTIEFRGLKCMERNSTKAKVLYAKVQEETGQLQKIADQISKYFVQQGFSRKEHDNVTLHMTVINTFYLKKKKQKFMHKNFDATQILKDHENTYFGKINLSTFHLSQLTAKSADGYFEATAKIEL